MTNSSDGLGHAHGGEYFVLAVIVHEVLQIDSLAIGLLGGDALLCEAGVGLAL